MPSLSQLLDAVYENYQVVNREDFEMFKERFIRELNSVFYFEVGNEIH